MYQMYAFQENTDATVDCNIDPDEKFSKKIFMFDMRYP